MPIVGTRSLVRLRGQRVRMPEQQNVWILKHLRSKQGASNRVMPFHWEDRCQRTQGGDSNLNFFRNVCCVYAKEGQRACGIKKEKKARSKFILISVSVEVQRQLQVQGVWQLSKVWSVCFKLGHGGWGLAGLG